MSAERPDWLRSGVSAWHLTQVNEIRHAEAGAWLQFNDEETPMRTRTALSLACIAALMSTTLPLHAQSAASAPAAQSGMTFDLRMRYEGVDDAAIARSADATTARARLGYRFIFNPTFSGLVEVESTGHLGSESYNSTANGQTSYPPVVDPDNTELNQAVLNFTPNAAARISLGRQRLIYGNQRFVGNVGWRQNEQTFDALDAQYKFSDGPSLRYSYLDRVQRIYGDDHPNRNLARWDLDAHVLELSQSVGPGLLSGYALLFDNRTLPLTSHRNLGIRYAAQGGPVDGLGWLFSAEYAHQSPYADGADRNNADYVAVEGGLRWKGNVFNAGLEVLGGDGSYGFQTPLATLHAFDGWADRFLSTPVNGLRDVYLGWKRGFGQIAANVVLHDFEADHGGASYGSEFDASLTWAFRPKWNAQLKFARYNSDGFSSDVDKLWLGVEYKL
jgi:hypothetical protein